MLLAFQVLGLAAATALVVAAWLLVYWLWVRVNDKHIVRVPVDIVRPDNGSPPPSDLPGDPDEWQPLSGLGDIPAGGADGRPIRLRS